MLKWMVTAKNDKNEISVKISNDPLDALIGQKEGHYSKIYCVNR